MRFRYLSVIGAVAAVAALSLTTAGAASANPAASPLRTSNWNGYIGQVASPNYVDDVQSTFTVPKLACTKGEDGPSAAPWVGLGGVPTDFSPLVQIGIWSQCLDVKGKEVQGDTAVYEVIQDNIFGYPLFDTGVRFNYKLPVGPGDSMSATVSFNKNEAGGTYQLYEADTTRHWVWSFSYVTTLNRTYPKTAEWVVENPYSNGTPLANFGTFEFTHCFYELDGVYYLPLTDSAIVRTHTSSRVTVYPVDLTGTSPYWNAIGKLHYVG